MQEYFSLLTATGANLLINAVANKTPVKLSKIAVSDSEIAPSEAATELENTKHEFAINSLTQDPQNPSILNVEGVIPSNVGGFHIRKFAIFTQSGEMFAVGRVPLSYKPALNQGAGSDLIFKIRILVGNVSNIELKVDNSVVLATRDWSEKTFQKLTDAIDAYSKTQADEKFMGKGEAYSKTQSDERYLEKTQANLFIQKDKFNAYTNEEPLPAGDMNSKDYWAKIKPGFYWFNSDVGGYVNKPARYAHFLVLRHPESSDLQVLCFEHPSHKAFHFWANGSESGGWEYINKSLGVGQEYKDVKNERRGNETYENTTGGPIFVCVSSGSMSGSCVAQFKMNGVVFATKVGNSNEGVFFSVPVPPGASYSVNLSGAAIAQWFELR